jgi:hypothetical protein
MGDKYKKPRSDAKKAPPQPRDKSTSGENGGSSNGNGKQECWSFSLVGITDAGRKVKEGANISGVPQRTRVMVLEAGVLGYAPDREANEMIQAANGTGKELKGTILSKDKTGANIKAELCLT